MTVIESTKLQIQSSWRAQRNLTASSWCKPLLLLLCMATSAALAPKAQAQTFGCFPAMANDIVCENSKTGTPASTWDVPAQMGDAGDPTIQGFATDISVNRGATVFFKIKTNASAYHLDIYRMGYYQGNGARKIATLTPSASLPQNQPACLTDAATLLYDCGNWAVSASWHVPSSATSGIYFARLRRDDTGGASYIVFIVRNDQAHSDVLFQTADETWQAYNDYGGHSLYGSSANEWDITQRAYKVSYNRPFNTAHVEIATWVFSAEYPMVRWLEANGYDVSYFTHTDGARSASLIRNHKLYMSNGHDEYWSGDLRTAVESARDAGVNLAFFSGNEAFWKTRWESSIDGSGTAYRTLVCYKETFAGDRIDPLAPAIWTGSWRDPRFSPPGDGGRPENGMTGTLFEVNGPAEDNNLLAIQVPAQDGKMRFWRNTGVANLSPGQTATFGAGTLGYEWDIDADNGARPAGLFNLSTTTQVLTSSYLLDYGGVYGPGLATHHLTLYRASSGALVFGAGTVQWSWGLDDTHDNPFDVGSTNSPADPDMQQATVNLFADMGIQPASLQAGLLAATKSTDSTPPASLIASPSPGAILNQNAALSIVGTASDSGGGVVAGIEVSFDNGQTWHPATGRANWTYAFTPTQLGATTLLSRAVDDSGNLETPATGVPITIIGPYNLSGVITPAAAGSGASVSLSGPSSATVTADASGNFSALGVFNGDYTLTPSKPGYLFNPISKVVAVSNASVTGVHFTAAQSAAGTHSISGSVTPSPSGAGVIITLSGSAAASAETDGSGHFVISGLPDGTYTLTPSKTNSVFSPTQASVTVSGADSSVAFSAASTQQTLFTTQVPQMVGMRDGSLEYELGVSFQSNTPGRITAIRFWKDAQETGTHIGTIWSSAGSQLTWVVFTNETASGWQQQALSTPITIAANTRYIVSVNTGDGFYVATDDELASQVVNGNLRTLLGNNGLYGPVGSVPVNTYQSANYYRDVVFVSSAISTLSSVNLNSNSVLGGTSIGGTVTLTGPAPGGGAVLTLTSDDPAASVPATITIPAGATTATFTVSTSAVPATTPVLISGIYNELHMAILLVTQPALGGITLNPASVTGGNLSTGTVLLTGPAPSGGAVVTLSSNNAITTVPAAVTVAAGLTTADFAISTSAVASATSATITATYNGIQTAILAVNPPVLSSLSLNPATVVGGNASAGSVTLTGPAPAGGVVVALSSNNAAATLPGSVAIAEGAVSGIFQINTISASTATSAGISATYLGTQSATLNINVASPATVILAPNSLAGGNSSTGTVTLSGPAPAGGAVVALSADNAIVSAIEGVHSAAGLPQSGSLDWSTLGPDFTPIDSGTSIAIPGQQGASLTLSNAGGLQMQVLTNCGLGGDCSWYGNFADRASVLWIDGLYHNDTGWWAPNGPLTIHFSTPQRGFGFQMMGDEFGPWSATLCAYNASDTLLGCVPFKGAAAGVGSGTADNSAAFVGLYDDAQEITRVTVDGGGQLYAHDFALASLFVTATRRQIVPASVTIPAGAISGDFPIGTGAVSTATNVNITANYNGSRNAVLTINPAVLSSISLDPNTVTGATALTGTATLTGTAPGGGVVVSLSADDPLAHGLQKVTDENGLLSEGSVNWSNVGPQFTSIDSGTSVPVSGVPGLNLKLETVNSLPTMVLSACPGIDTCGWSGNFIPGAPLLWVGGNYLGDGSWAGNGPLILTLSTPVRGIGFNIMADESGPFNGNMCAYDSSDALLGCVPFAGNGAPFAGGTNGFAPFAGVYDDLAEIAKITVDAGGQLYPHDFAIGSLTVSQSRRMVPASVKVEAGATSATFTVNTESVDAPTSATITGTYQQTHTADLTIIP